MDDSQQLFLIEFLVDKVNIPAIRAIHEEMLPVTTCVSFQVLGLPPININEEASVDKCACLSGDVQVFKKGKSCLFALPNNVLQKPIHSFPVTMSVYKKLPPGVLPDVMLIGTHQIQLRNLINDLLSQRIFKNGNPCRSLKSTFRITTATGQGVGEATIFIRVSCFGKKIVTQFQIPHNKKPYLFKGSEDSPVFQCKRIPSNIFLPEPVRCNCPVKKSPDGSGEGQICCPETKSDMDKRKQAHCEPCCLCSQQPISNCSDLQPQQQCQAEYLNSKNYSLRTAHAVAANTCISCCSPQPIKDITCAPCCGTKGTTFDELLKEKPVRKCGCIIKEKPTCNCKQTCS
ncbi:PREDICTED: uncharacterized protein LOC107070397 [Polistes dominula]|uniref:Uncharacterized protein LOC107070397 n=1 Tax=Polistes dominula TaxID=743375 RepID=A0ABM1IV09_POLDO|nr:PREDICTED: uncharacterized protein LOC107070397 [Polistes dominula]